DLEFPQQAQGDRQALLTGALPFRRSRVVRLCRLSLRVETVDLHPSSDRHRKLGGAGRSGNNGATRISPQLISGCPVRDRAPSIDGPHNQASGPGTIAALAVDDHQLDAPVQLAAVSGEIRRDRPAVPQANRLQPLALDAGPLQVLGHRAGALLGETHVALWIAAVVRVALDPDPP